MRYGIVLALAALMGAPPAAAQDPEKQSIEAERRALDAERRALEAERRAAEAERRAQAAQRGGDVERQRMTCEAATANAQTMCARPAPDPLWETPPCAEAQMAVRQQCGGG